MDMGCFDFIPMDDFIYGIRAEVQDSLVKPEVYCPAQKLEALGVTSSASRNNVTILPPVLSDPIAAYEATQYTYGFTSYRSLLR
jgi:hypothetical protein